MLLVSLCCWLPLTWERACDAQESASAAALTTIFSPLRAPEQKTMGLLQRSFLDLAEQEGSLLQLAIVVDGTDSMATELAGVRQSITSMIEDLRRTRGDNIEIALVIYRDQASPSGEVSVPLKAFSKDIEAIANAVEKIVAESGAPFFHELADVGLHTALSELPWSNNPADQRWIMLFGDAPPYEETFKDDKYPEARRRYATELLVALAARKAIRVNCVLCTSDEAVKEPYDKAIDQTRNFMTALASGTDGLMLDLSYPEIRQAIIDSSKTPDVQYVQIAPIERTDLTTMAIAVNPAAQAGSSIEPVQDALQPSASAARVPEVNASPNGSAAASVTQDVRVAVIPHLPLDAMSFDPAHPAVQVATAIRNDFASVPGVRVASPIDIQTQLRRLRADSVSDDQKLRALAARLGVDYVIWGSLESAATIQTAAYRRNDGARVLQVSIPGNDQQPMKALLSVAAASPTEKDGQLGGLLKRIERSLANSESTQPLASTEATRREVLAAMESLEQALALPAGSEESITLLRSAEKSLATAAASEARNPLVHWLASNTAFNLASYHFGQGDSEAGSNQIKTMGKLLSRAYRDRASIKLKSLATEVEADYQLLVSKDTKAAIAGYQTLTAADQPSATQKRGHWMLAGIYAGDWGVDDKIADPKLAREHIVALLAGWEESPEAQRLQKWLRWDDSAGKTKFSYLPIVNRQLAKLVPNEPAE